MKMIKRGNVGFVGVAILAAIAIGVCVGAILLQNTIIQPSNNVLKCPVHNRELQLTHSPDGLLVWWCPAGHSWAE